MTANVKGMTFDLLDTKCVNTRPRPQHTKPHHVTHQSLQDPLALVVGAVVGQDGPVDQNQAVQEHPGTEPEQSEDQGPPAGPHPEAQPPEQAEPATSTPSTRPHLPLAATKMSELF